jgi:hypothetical protein
MSNLEIMGGPPQSGVDRLEIRISSAADQAALYDRLVSLIARRVFGVGDVVSAFTMTMTQAQRDLIMHRDPFDIVAIRLGYDLGAESDALLAPYYANYIALKSSPDWVAIVGRDQT